MPDIEDPIIDLFAAETATVLAFTDYFAGAALDKLSPLIRRRIYHEVNRRVLTPMLTAEYYWLGLKTPDKKVAIYSHTFAGHGFSPLPEYVEPLISPVNRSMRHGAGCSPPSSRRTRHSFPEPSPAESSRGKALSAACRLEGTTPEAKGRS